MKISFSTLACPAWTLDAAMEAATRLGYDGIELRFIENDDRLWQRPEFSGSGLRTTRTRLADAGLQVPCLDTSCFFHYPETSRRHESLEMGRAMIELAVGLGAPAIRVFGDRVQEGADRAATKGWIVDGVRELADFGCTGGVQIWLESHGDFARACDTRELLQNADRENTGVIWDPLNAYSEFGEEPQAGFSLLGDNIRHVHIKDGCPSQHGAANQCWEPVLMGTGEFPARSLIQLLTRSGYDRFVSFEWEKRWHPRIAEPELALPQFMSWIRGVLEA
jgi:sugar phosphate isomerase/epimerase